MSEQETNETGKKLSLRDTIAPKSDQLNYDDLANGARRRVKVVTLKAGSPEQPVRVVIVDAATGEKMRDYVPSKSMRRVLIACWGDDARAWIGKQIELTGDPKIKFGGIEVGGLRVVAVSGIVAPVDIALSVTRGKRERVTAQVIKEETK